MSVSKRAAMVRIILYYDDPKKAGDSMDFTFDKISRASLAYDRARYVLFEQQRKDREEATKLVSLGVSK